MKRKGFTLIELLAVIVILSVITLITVPMITSVIEESKKKALISSVQGLIESANLYAIEKEGVHEFLFDSEHQGSTQNGESLDYRGSIDGEGKLYIDKEGNTSACISNDTYYVYKNYNSEIIVGERKKGNCIIGFDALTNKYIAMLDDGTGQVSNVYSKDEVNNLLDGKVIELNNKIEANTSEINNIKNSVEELQNNSKVQWKKIAETTSTDGINIDFNVSDYSEILLVALRSDAFVLASTVSTIELYNVEPEGIVVEHSNVSVCQFKKINDNKAFLKVNKASTYSNKTVVYAR